jgi:toxin FitB
MKFLLDTNVVSELSNSRPNSQVEEWLVNAVDTDLYISCVTLAEVAKGITILPAGKRRVASQQWLDERLRPWFDGRVLSIDATIAERAGVAIGESQIQGRTMSLADALIATTALVYDLTLVTRNVKDFTHLTDLQILNPWE